MGTLLTEINNESKSSQMLVFDEERGNPEKTSRCRVENQQTQPTYDADSGNPTPATLVGGECSHHCAIPAPKSLLFSLILQPVRINNTGAPLLGLAKSIYYNKLSRTVQFLFKPLKGKRQRKKAHERTNNIPIVIALQQRPYWSPS